MTAPNVLALHIDSPEQRHRLVLLDEKRLRCHDCSHTIVIPAGSSVAASTSTSLPLGLRDTRACKLHVGQREAFCGPCRSEQIEAVSA